MNRSSVMTTHFKPSKDRETQSTRMTTKKEKKKTTALHKKEPSSAVGDIEKWLAIRRKAGLRIDPKTAEVLWMYVQILDPYGVNPDLSPECQQVGRDYFARSPGSDVWVWFGDLPATTQNALWERHKSELAFPAGLSNGVSKRKAKRRK
jgi:hypothetical protein